MKRNSWVTIFTGLVFFVAQASHAEEIPYILEDAGQLQCIDTVTGKSLPCESEKFDPKLTYVTHADALILFLDPITLRVPVNHGARLCYDLYYHFMSRPYCLDHPSIEISTSPELKNGRIVLTLTTQTRGTQNITEIRSGVVFIPENKQ